MDAGTRPPGRAPAPPPYPAPRTLPVTPSEISAAELAAARAVARRAGRPLFAVCAPADAVPGATPGATPVPSSSGRRLSFDRPRDPSELAYWVDRNGDVRFGPAARPAPPPPGAALVRDPADVAPRELAAAREYALVTGRTVFVAEVGLDADASAMHFAVPLDGSLRYAVRVTGELLVGERAAAEPPGAVRDAGWTPRVAARLRQLRRLRERAAELAPLGVVRPQDWARVERLVPEEERSALRPGDWIGARGAEAADALAAAADREVQRMREEGGRLTAHE